MCIQLRVLIGCLLWLIGSLQGFQEKFKANRMFRLYFSHMTKTLVISPIKQREECSTRPEEMGLDWNSRIY